MLTLDPVSFPGSQTPCVYLFHKGQTAKVGYSTNLKNRSAEYRGRKFTCLAYAGPVSDPREAERDLIAYFARHFKAKHKNGEWVEATAEQAGKVFGEWWAGFKRAF